MTVKLILQIIGAIIAITGFVLAYNPELVSREPMPADVFQAIEQRMKWSVLIGLGMLLIFHHQLQPWLLTVSAILFFLVLGFVSARILGIVLDGVVVKQLYWLGAELAALIIFGLWYWKQLH